MAGITPERVLRSVRSIVSLGSSRGPYASKTSVDRVTHDAASSHNLDKKFIPLESD